MQEALDLILDQGAILFEETSASGTEATKLSWVDWFEGKVVRERTSHCLHILKVIGDGLSLMLFITIGPSLSYVVYFIYGAIFYMYLCNYNFISQVCLNLLYKLPVNTSVLFTAMHGMQMQSSNENSVCPSVKHVDCDKMEERSVHIFIPSSLLLLAITHRPCSAVSAIAELLVLCVKGVILL